MSFLQRIGGKENFVEYKMLLGKLGFLVIECIDWAFIFEPRQVRSYEFMLVRTYVCPISVGISLLVSFKNFEQRQKSPNRKKVTEADFPEKFLFALKFTRSVHNGVSLSFHKTLSLLFAGSKIREKLQFCFLVQTPCVYRKALLFELYVKMLSSNYIGKFFDHHYIWK